MTDARNTRLRHHVNELMRQFNPQDPRIVEPFSPTDINTLDEDVSNLE